MPNNYDDNENSQMSGSIFSTPGINNPQPMPQPADIKPERQDFFSSLIKQFTSIIIAPETGQDRREQRKLQKIADKIEEDSGDLIQVMKEFGAKLVYKPDSIDIIVSRLGLMGKLTTDENGELVLDEYAKEIFSLMAKYINDRNSFDSTMNTYEEMGFYPVGELKKETITYKGRELDVLKGILANNQGEQKIVYMYNGHEIILDKDNSERQNQ